MPLSSLLCENVMRGNKKKLDDLMLFNLQDWNGKVNIKCVKYI